MDEVFSWPICVLPVHIGTWDMELLHGDTDWSACCIPPVREVWMTEPWRLDWTARD